MDIEALKAELQALSRPKRKSKKITEVPQYRIVSRYFENVSTIKALTIQIQTINADKWRLDESL